jgi:hypothetical protein
MSQSLLSTPDAIVAEIAKWHFELLCELNRADPICSSRLWENGKNLKLIKLAGQPAAQAQIGKPAAPPPDYDTIFECSGQEITLSRDELARLGIKHHFGKDFGMIDFMAEDFAQMLVDLGPREMIIQLKGAAGEVMD